MPPPLALAGADITADAGAYMVPVDGLKAADQSVTSSTVLVNDTALFVPVTANYTYQFEAYINFEGGTLGSSDLKWAFTVPAGTTMRYTPIGATTAGTAQVGLTVTESTAGLTAGTSGAGNLKGLYLAGTLTVAATAGNVQFQWAQNTSSGTATIVHATSWIVLRRIA